MIVSILLVILILSLLVFVHELGHFVVARRNGVEVDEFGFGLPPRIWGLKRGKTIYSINLFPIGGFVRLKGETGQTEGPGTFASASYKSKIKILLAGVTMNALVGYLLLVYLCLTGLPPIPNTDINLSGSSFARGPEVLLVEVSPGSAAEVAGLKKGDAITAGNSLAFTSEDDLRTFTKANAGEEVSFSVRRGNEKLEKPVLLSQGDENGGQLGVVPMKNYLVKFSPIKALTISANLLWKIVVGTAVGFVGLLANLPSIVGGVAGGSTPSVDAVGPIGIVFIFKDILYWGLPFILLITVNITISLAVINSLPIPALDGGRVLLTSISRFIKYIPRNVENALNGGGFVFLILLIILIFIVDGKRFF